VVPLFLLVCLIVGGDSSSGSVWSLIINYAVRLFNVEIYTATVLMAGILPEDRSDEQKEDADRDHGKYKNYCENPPRRIDYPDDCSFWVASIVHLRKCIQKMEEFDKKWTDNRHADNALFQRRKSLENLIEKVNNICKK